MNLNEQLRRAASLAAAVTFVVSAAQRTVAEAPTVTASFSATTTGLSAGAGVTLSIELRRWSTDEESAKLVTAFKDKSDKWADALDAAPPVGYVWPTGANLGYSVKLARQLPSNGGSRIILAVSPALGSWERPAWKGPNDLATDYPFTVIELRVNKAGIGDGKASLAGKVVVEEGTKVVALENYTAAPVLIKNVKKNGASGAAARPGASPGAK
jgi:hypothetical protein